MSTLDVSHPDIVKFIRAKNVDHVLSNFNISVMISDSFMEAVKHDLPWNLINPRTKAIAQTIPARQIFDLICEQAHKNGEPGVLFYDTINRHNPTKHLGTIESTNP